MLEYVNLIDRISKVFMIVATIEYHHLKHSQRQAISLRVSKQAIDDCLLCAKGWPHVLTN